MTKTVIGTIILAAAGAALFGVAYWGFLEGVRSSSIYDAQSYAFAIKQQDACIDERDWECAKVTHEVIASFLAVRLEILEGRDLVDESVEESVTNYLSWYRKQVGE